MKEKKELYTSSIMNDSATIAAEKEENTVGLRNWVYAIAIPLLLIGGAVSCAQIYGISFGNITSYGFPKASPLFLCLGLLLVNPIARLAKSNFRFKARDLVIIWVLGEIISRQMQPGWFSTFFGSAIRLRWLQLKDPINVPLLGRFSPWLSVDEAAVFSLQRGNSSVPWGAWIKPAIAWGFFYFAAFVFIICLSAIVRRRWTDQEHLSFGYARVQLASFEMVERPKWYRNALLWLGVIVYTIWHGGWIQKFWPMWPQLINLNWPGVFRGIYGPSPIRDNPVLYTAFGRWGNFRIYDYPALWFAPTDFLFSVWFFDLLKSFVALFLVKINAYGLLPGNYLSRQNAIDAPVMLAGAVGIAITYLWALKPELKEMWKKARGNPSLYDDDLNEAMSIKWAVWGVISSFIVLTVYGSIIFKTSPILVILNLVFWFGMAITSARLVAETGVYNTQVHTVQQYLGARYFHPMFNLQRFGLTSVLGQGLLQAFGWDNSLHVMSTSLIGWKMGDSVGLTRRHVTRLIVIAIILGIAGTFILNLPLFYKAGYDPDSYRIRVPLLQMDSAYLPYASGQKASLGAPNPYVLITSIGSIGLTLLLGWARMNYASFPLHPLGFWLGAGYLGRWYIEACFGQWLIKTLVFRYGGVQVFRKLTPFWIGMIAGGAFHSLASYIATVIRLLTR